MKRSYKVNGDSLELSFSVPPVEFNALLAFVKSIQGRKWNPTKKIWTIPNKLENTTLIEGKGFTPDGVYPKGNSGEVYPIR